MLTGEIQAKSKDEAFGKAMNEVTNSPKNFGAFRCYSIFEVGTRAQPLSISIENFDT